MFWGWLCLPSSSSGRGSGLLCLPRTRVHLRDNLKLGLCDDLRVCCGLHLRDDFGVCSGFLAFGFHLRDDFRVCSAFLLQGLIFWATLGLHLGGGFRVRFGNTKRIQTIQHNKEKIQRTHTRTYTHTHTHPHTHTPTHPHTHTPTHTHTHHTHTHAQKYTTTPLPFALAFRASGLGFPKFIRAY